MGVANSVQFLALFRQYRLLDPTQIAELETGSARFASPNDLARELVHRGWLTTYQANETARGRAADLLLGSYVLLEKLGEGGMGAVFKARNWKLGRVVALKLIKKERLTNDTAVQRFEREIRAASQLDHPNIVRALDADCAGDVHFLVMEYVPGIDLAKLVKQRGPLPIADACDYLRQAALGLQHAHERGLVHRDIKPHNLLLTQASGERQPPAGNNRGVNTPRSPAVVKILDFGLARIDRQAAEDSSSELSTADGTVMGTLDYIAPEQAIDAHSADIRADLYSLGCTLYHLLAGRVPFQGGSAGEKIAKHLAAFPRPLEELRPDVPPAVVAIVRKLMAKKPEERYQTPAEAAAALANARLEPISAVLPAPVPQPDVTLLDFSSSSLKTPAAGFNQRQLRLALGVATVGVVLLLAMFVAMTYRRPRPIPVVEPVRPVEVGQRKPQRAETEPTIPPGFVLLFNGTNLDGWEVKQGRESDWLIRDGTLATGKVSGIGWLGTRRKYGDFELSLQWRPPATGAYNSGVYFRAIPTGGQYATGHQIELASNAPIGLLHGPKVEASSVRGGRVWNDLHIKVGAGRIVVTSNGQKVNDTEIPRGNPPVPPAGFIGLERELGEVEFRNIWIKGQPTDQQDDEQKQARLVASHTGIAWFVGTAIHPDGKTLYALNRDGRLFYFDPITGAKRGNDERVCWDKDGKPTSGHALAISPDGKTVAIADSGRRIHLRRGEVRHLNLDGAEAGSLAYAPNGDLIAGCSDGVVRRWSPMDAPVPGENQSFDAPVSVAVGKTGMAVWSTKDGNVWLDGKLFLKQDHPAARGNAVAFSSEGGLLATCVLFDQVVIYDRATQQKKQTLPGHAGLSSLAFSPDGRLLATGDRNGKVRIWATATGTRLTELEGRSDRKGDETGAVNTLAFSPDGKTLVSGTWTLKIWDVSAFGEPAQAAWQPLLNGKGLSDWRLSSYQPIPNLKLDDVFAVEQADGEPVLHVKQKELEDRENRIQLTQGVPFANYHLRFQARVLKHNVYLNYHPNLVVTQPGQPTGRAWWNRDMRIELGAIRNGTITPIPGAPAKPPYPAGAVAAARPGDQWNDFEIIRFGDHTVHRVNGQVAAVIAGVYRDDAPNKAIRDRQVVLTVWPGAEAYFRRMEIRPITELPADLRE